MGSVDLQAFLALAVTFLSLVVHLIGKPFDVDEPKFFLLHQLEFAALTLCFFTLYAKFLSFFIFFSSSSPSSSSPSAVLLLLHYFFSSPFLFIIFSYTLFIYSFHILRPVLTFLLRHFFPSPFMYIYCCIPCCSWGGLLFYLGHDKPGTIDPWVLICMSIAIVVCNCLFLIVALYEFVKEFINDQYHKASVKRRSAMKLKLLKEQTNKLMAKMKVGKTIEKAIEKTTMIKNNSSDNNTTIVPITSVEEEKQTKRRIKISTAFAQRVQKARYISNFFRVYILRCTMF